MLSYQEFQEGMSSDEIEEKLKYVNQVLAMAKGLGKEETLGKLLPFLNDWCPDNDDEALAALAKEIYSLNELFTADEMACVLPILIHLATTEEVVVREAAVESINKIMEDMSPSVVNKEMIGLIDELFREDWFTPRVSSASLIAKAYEKISALNGEENAEESLSILRERFFALCKDDTPMVRRAAAKNMEAVFKIVPDTYILQFVEQFEDFFNSDDEAIKLTLMSFCKVVLTRAKEEGERAKVLSIIRNCIESRSYKVREAVALEIGEIGEIMGRESFTSMLLDPFITLLKDNNSDVRKNAIKQMHRLSKVLDEDTFLAKVFPFLPNLAKENNALIAEEVTGAVIDLSVLFPEKVRALYDLLLDNSVQQVRLLLLRRLEEIQLNEELIRRIVVDEKMDGTDWRVREEVAKHMAFLLDAMKDNSLQDKLIEIYMELFNDNVSKVREACRNCLDRIIQTSGADFCFTKIISRLQKLYDSSNNYLFQFNILYAYQLVILEVPTDSRALPLINCILGALSNHVPNVRFIACKIIGDLTPVLSSDVKSTAITKLTELQKDEDVDVRYYASLGLKKVRSM